MKPEIKEALEAAVLEGHAAAMAQYVVDGMRDCGACGGAMLQFDARSAIAKAAVELGLARTSGNEIWALIRLPQEIQTQHGLVYQAMMDTFRAELTKRGYGAAAPQRSPFMRSLALERSLSNCASSIGSPPPLLRKSLTKRRKRMWPRNWRSGAVPPLHTGACEGTHGVKMTSDDSTKDDAARRAAVAMMRRGDATPAEAAQMAGVSRQLASYWAKVADIDWEKARSAKLREIWNRTFKP